MNEFTEEELQYMSNYIFKGHSCISVDKHDALKDKRQRMIETHGTPEAIRKRTEQHGGCCGEHDAQSSLPQVDVDRCQLEDELEQHVSPYCDPQHNHLWVRGKCYDCGVEKCDTCGKPYWQLKNPSPYLSSGEYFIFNEGITKIDEGQLVKKIQSMIDNYCEHEWEHTKATENYLYCFKCKSTVGKK